MTWPEAFVDGVAWVCVTFLAWRAAGAVWYGPMGWTRE